MQLHMYKQQHKDMRNVQNLLQMQMRVDTHAHARFSKAHAHHMHSVNSATTHTCTPIHTCAHAPPLDVCTCITHDHTHMHNIKQAPTCFSKSGGIKCMRAASASTHTGTCTNVCRRVCLQDVCARKSPSMSTCVYAGMPMRVSARRMRMPDTRATSATTYTCACKRVGVHKLVRLLNACACTNMNARMCAYM